MQPFTLSEPPDLQAALAAHAGASGARYLAGGTTLVDLMKLYVETPTSVVLIDRIPGLDAVEATPAGGVRIGGLARMSAVAEHPLLRDGFPAVSDALLLGASGQIRNMASIGGNLLQRTRCTYFRDTGFDACNKRAPGSGCAAWEGNNFGHAVLGTSRACIATYPGDLAVALVAFDAAVLTLAPSGAERRIPLGELHCLPGDTPHVETVLLPGEFITAVELPPPSAITRCSRYLKVRERASYAFALASAAVGLDLDGDCIREARVALGGVGTKPWRVPAAEATLRGRPVVEASFAAAAEAAMEGAAPRPGNAYKVELAKRTLVRALAMARDGTPSFPGRRDA